MQSNKASTSNKAARRAQRAAGPVTTSTPAVQPAVVVATTLANGGAVAAQQPAVATTTNPVAASTMLTMPATKPQALYYVMGKPYAPRNTGSAAHAKQGDVAIFNGFAAAMAAHPQQHLTPAAAAAAVKAVNPKNMAFIGYCVTRGWLLPVYAVAQPAAPAAPATNGTPAA
jgi:hypothetical protein